MTGKKRAIGPSDPKDPSRPTQSAQDSVSPADAALVTLPTIEPSKGLLTPFQRRFTTEYLIDLNGAQAYIRARGEKLVTYATAAVEASKLLHRPNVVAELQRLMDERATITGITADRMLLKLWEAATADPRELVEHRIGSCRHCWGLYNQYQYTDAEFSAANDKHVREQASQRRKDSAHVSVEFHEKGGPGFDPSRPPNPECPECWGDGHGRVMVKDSRKLSPGALMLMDGYKVDKHGNIEVKVGDRAQYIQMIGRHLGMFLDKVKVDPSNPDANPLAALLTELQQRGSSLPIVHKDPEAEDVHSRPANNSSSAPGADPSRKTGAWKAVATTKGKA